MFYGALKDCPVCGGTVHYDGHTYICEGAYSEWSICTYSTRDPPRLEEPINFPDFVQKSAISDLLMECRDSKGKPKRELKATDKPFVGMLISLSGRLSRTHQYRKNKIEKHGGKVANHVIGVTCLVVASSFRDRGGRQKLQKHSLEPFFSAVASQFVLGQQIPFSLWLSLAPIVLGVSMASLTELSFNWLGFTSAMISNISFTYRSIYSKKAMTGMDSTNVCAYISIIALLFCLPPAILIEGPKLMQSGFRDVIAKVGMVKFVYDLFWIEMFYHLYNQIATNTNRCIKFNTSYQLPVTSYQLPVTSSLTARLGRPRDQLMRQYVTPTRRWTTETKLKSKK